MALVLICSGILLLFSVGIGVTLFAFYAINKALKNSREK